MSIHDAGAKSVTGNPRRACTLLFFLEESTSPAENDAQGGVCRHEPGSSIAAGFLNGSDQLINQINWALAKTIQVTESSRVRSLTKQVQCRGITGGRRRYHGSMLY